MFHKYELDKIQTGGSGFAAPVPAAAAFDHVAYLKQRIAAKATTSQTQAAFASVTQPQAAVGQPQAVNVARIKELQRMDAQRKMGPFTSPGVASGSRPSPLDVQFSTESDYHGSYHPTALFGQKKMRLPEIPQDCYKIIFEGTNLEMVERKIQEYNIDIDMRSRIVKKNIGSTIRESFIFTSKNYPNKIFSQYTDRNDESVKINISYRNALECMNEEACNRLKESRLWEQPNFNPNEVFNYGLTGPCQ